MTWCRSGRCEVWRTRSFDSGPGIPSGKARSEAQKPEIFFVGPSKQFSSRSRQGGAREIPSSVSPALHVKPPAINAKLKIDREVCLYSLLACAGTIAEHEIKLGGVILGGGESEIHPLIMRGLYREQHIGWLAA